MATRDDIESTIAAAERLVQSSGALSRQPTVHELRAQLARLAGDEPGQRRELAEAMRLYTAMGATCHVERLSREIGR